MADVLYNVLFLFFIYSFLGWCVEVAFVAVTVGKVENRGFLNGAICPIYGCGMLGVLAILTPVKDNLILLFLGGMLVCSALELFGGWVLDKIFHMRWWNYSNKPFDVGGYICLEFSIMWGLAVVFVIRIIHPVIMAIVDVIPEIVGIILLSIFSIVFVVDFVETVQNLMGIRKNLNQLDKLAEDMRNAGDQLKDVIGNSAISVAERADESKEKLEEFNEANKEKWEAISNTNKEKWEAINNTNRERWEDISNKTRERLENINGITKERWENISESSKASRDKFTKQIEELLDRRDELTDKTLKRSRHRLNKMPALHRKGRTVDIKEYINTLKENFEESRNSNNKENL